MLTLYRFVSYLVYGWFFLVGRRSAGRGEPLWRGRLGLIESSGPSDIWLHAASVGEIRVVSYLVDYLLTKRPSLRIHVTTMTRAGYRTARQLLENRVTTTFFPLDAPPAVRRTLDRIEPRVLVIAETEIWPNLIIAATRRSIPTVQVNGRMSEPAFKRYRYVRRMLGGLVNRYHRWFIKTDLDAERYRRFGLDDDKIEVAGDMKFDAPLRQFSADQVRRVRQRAGAGPDGFLFVAGSTRPGEEVMLAELYQALSPRLDRLRMVIAPRHVERVREITSELDKMNLKWRLYGVGSPADQPYDSAGALVIVDTVGQLNEIYAAADLAFVGGTLVPIGGHNLLEPVWAQTPVLYGLHNDNVREAAEYIAENNYGRQVDDALQLTSMLEQVYQGRLKFAVKQETDLRSSATARIGNYLLEMFGDV
jgi:3-deoxy-D-manno-octulosonic-acid transferase